MVRRFLVSAAALALLAVPALAQPAPASTNAATPDAPASAEQPFQPPRGNMRTRLQGIHDRLGITPAQQPQWDAVVAALRENARALRADPADRAVRAGNLNAVQSLQAASALASDRAAALQRLLPPVEALYAALSPDQQREADGQLAAAMGAGRHPRRG